MLNQLSEKKTNTFAKKKKLYFQPSDSLKCSICTVYVSQIQAMNFASHHTVSHRSLKDYISHHTLHQHSCLHWSRTHLQTITQSPSPNHTHTHTLHKPWTFSHSLPSIVSLATYKAFPCFLSLFPVFPSILGLISRVLILPVPLDYSLCLAHWIKFADRRPTLALGLFSASSLLYLFATVWPCLYRLCYWIKSLHLDPNVSRLVIPVTEYSARQDPAAFQRVIQKVWMSREICLPLSKVLDLWSNILGSSWSSLTIQICRTLYWLRFFAMALISLCNHNSDARDRGHH